MTLPDLEIESTIHESTTHESTTHEWWSSVKRYAIYGLEVRTDFPFTWPLPSVGGCSGPHGSGEQTRRILEFTCSGGPAPWLKDTPLPPPGVPGRTEWIAGGGSDQSPDILRFGGVADHFIGERRIHCRTLKSEYRYLVEIQFLGLVLAAWLTRRRIPVLHAAAVRVKGAGVAIAGEKGSGKTTLAGALVAAGHPLLADDLLVVEGGTREAASSNRPWAHSGIPLLRATPEQIRALGLPEASGLVHPAFHKRKVLLGQGWGEFHPEGAPLTRVYLPCPRRGPRRTPGSGEGLSVGFEPVSRKHVLPTLLGQAFLGDRLAGWGLVDAAVDAWTGLLRRQRVSVRRLHYPFGLEHLPEVVAAVEEDVSTP